VYPFLLYLNGVNKKYMFVVVDTEYGSKRGWDVGEVEDRGREGWSGNRSFRMFSNINRRCGD